MHTNIKNLFSILLLLGTPFITLAAESAPATNTGSSLNPVFVVLVSLMIILLFAIAALGGVLKNLAYAYRNKMREEKANNKSQIVKSILLLMAFGSLATKGFAADEVAPVDTAPQLIGGMDASQFYLLSGTIIFELVVTISLVLIIRLMIKLIVAKPEIANSEAAKAALAKAKKVNFWDRFNQAVDIDKEEDIMLDHNYDGIRELDNSLPPWWKYGFYLTILVAIVYMWYYHGGGNGPSSYDEYVAEVKAGDEATAAYLAKTASNVDENTVKMGDAESIAAGKKIFVVTCAPCHLADGGGLVGPNLTDKYWLHGGSIHDIFKSIKYGWADKGMKSWKNDFSPRQIADLASFVKSLQGTTPATPKEKQGELYEENNTAPAKQDSTKTVVTK